MSSPDTAAVKTWLLSLQARIVSAVEAIDGKPFLTDSWQRPEGGGGISRLIEEGNVLERGGVGFSHVKRPTGPSWPAGRGKPWACPWFFIRVIRTRRRCT